MRPPRRNKEQTASDAGFAEYLREDTIASRITGPGGAVAVVRLSGPAVKVLLKSICPGVESWTPRTLYQTRILSVEGRVLDQGLAVFFQGPNSFTGEDVAELQLHGGGFVVGEVMRDLLRRGCRQALAGEFSFRAVRNGKMSIDAAQAVHDLVSAGSSVAHRMALERLSGTQARFFDRMAETLRSTLALAEVGIDFSDQDLEELELARLKEQVRAVKESLEQVAASIERGRRIQEGISLVIAGLPNAGKSTLFNQLLGEDRSLISDEQGTTRDVVRESVRVRSSTGTSEALFVIHDTAGLRDGAGHVERLGIELSRESVSNADLVLYVVDAANPQYDENLKEWSRLGAPASKTVLVLNKADLYFGSDAGDRREADLLKWRLNLSVSDGVAVSASRHEQVSELLDLLVSRAEKWLPRDAKEVVLTNQEQVEAATRALNSLNRAIAASGHDIFAADLRQALDQLSFFIGRTAADDILGRVFSQFCIGK